jgi:flagellar basal-body rod protein FlgB
VLTIRVLLVISPEQSASLLSRTAITASYRYFCVNEWREDSSRIIGITDKVDMTGIPSQFYLIADAMAYSQENHKVISHNIANVNTPHYRASGISFDSYMRAASSDQSVGLSSRTPVEQIQGLPIRSDGNSVDLDLEIGKLKKNASQYQIYSQFLSSQLDLMRRAIKG